MICSALECENPPRSSGRYCREHHNAYMREWRRLGRERLTPFQQHQARTRAYTNVLVARGKLTRLPCRDCGETPVQAHHPDYSDPRRVVWLCPAHHRQLHKQLGLMPALTA